MQRNLWYKADQWLLEGWGGRGVKWEGLQKSMRKPWGWWIISVSCILIVVMVSWVCTYAKLSKLYTLNMHGSMYPYYTSIKQFK